MWILNTFSRLYRSTAVKAIVCSSLISMAHAADGNLVRIVVPYAAGGGVDVVTRTVTGKMAEILGETIIVDNRPGASTNLGSELVVRAKPDGLTLLTASNTLASNGALFSKLTFDPATDLVPIGSIGNSALALVVNANSSYKTVADLIADGKANPKKLTYGSAGNGSSSHLAGELLKAEGKFDALHVPYKGGAPAVNDLLGGRLTFMTINPIEVASHVQAGKLRALAILDDKPSKLLPEVPTIVKLGMPKATATVWWGLVGPKGMEKDRIAKLDAALQKALADPEVGKQLEGRGAAVTPGSAAAFDEFVKAERVKWTKVILDGKIKAD
jgi:tripartite-type tricarboxylate transporter receptor subunit TctC